MGLIRNQRPTLVQLGALLGSLGAAMWCIALDLTAGGACVGAAWLL